MTADVKTRRRYESPRRRDQARATRGAVLEAARLLFIERGYAATTITAIAERADVSPETVYALFAGKRGLLKELLDVAIAGDDDAPPVLDQGWVDDLRHEPDVGRRLRMLAKRGTEILGRRAAVDDVLRGAASADPEVARLWRRTRIERFEGQRELLGLAVAGAAARLRIDLDTGAAIVYAIGSPEAYLALVNDRGWTPRQFEEWYGDALERMLLNS
jgi:AcrR family transcriptional regulator